jgi:threonine aldolase
LDLELEDPVIDLRSDTVTQPTRAMREAMLTAEVGDDVYGEDPSINALEARAAELTGKEAAVLVTSGTQGNLTAMMTHAAPGSEVILGAHSHPAWWEASGMSRLGGLFPRLVPDDGGVPRPEDVRAAIRPTNDPHAGLTALLCLENTHADLGGIPVPAERIAAVADVAHEHGLKVHLDGARLFNAAVALGVPAKELTAPVDSVTFCLSKGLGAPVGSVLCGSADFVEQARRVRKVLGGGMRQAGWFAAAGLIALEQHIDRLADDHEHARLLGELLRELPGLRLDPEVVYSNMVFVDVSGTGLTPEQITTALEARGVRTLPFDERRLRLVTHLWVTRQDVEHAAEAFREVIAESGVRGGVAAAR